MIIIYFTLICATYMARVLCPACIALLSAAYSGAEDKPARTFPRNVQ